MTHRKGERPTSSKEDDLDTVAALVRMLIASGFEPARIVATMAKSSKPAGLDLLSECFSDRHPATPARPPRRAA